MIFHFQNPYSIDLVLVFFSFMKSMAKYAINISSDLVNPWVDKRVTINDIYFHGNEEIIEMAIGLSMDEKKRQKVTKVMNGTCMNIFL